MAKGQVVKTYEVGGRDRLSVTEIAEKAGISPAAVYMRIRSGVKGEDLLAPSQRGKKAAAPEAKSAPAKKKASRKAAGKKAQLAKELNGHFGRAPATHDVGDGRELSAAEIAKEVGISYGAVLNRIKNGVAGSDLLVKDLRRKTETAEEEPKPKSKGASKRSFPRASYPKTKKRAEKPVVPTLSEEEPKKKGPPKKLVPVTVMMTMDEIAERAGVSKQTVANKLKKGLSGTDILGQAQA